MLQRNAILRLQSCSIIAGSIHWCMNEVHPLGIPDVSCLMHVPHEHCMPTRTHLMPLSFIIMLPLGWNICLICYMSLTHCLYWTQALSISTTAILQHSPSAQQLVRSLCWPRPYRGTLLGATSACTRSRMRLHGRQPVSACCWMKIGS